MPTQPSPKLWRPLKLGFKRLFIGLMAITIGMASYRYLIPDFNVELSQKTAIAVPALVNNWTAAATDVRSGGVPAALRAGAPLLADIELRQPVDHELANIRRMIGEIDPTIDQIGAKKESFALAMRLRDIVYKRTTLVNTWPDIQWADYDKWVYQTLFDPSKGHICLGLAATYGALLKAFDLPHREVSLFDQVAPVKNGHNSIEIFYEGRWIVSDPTFNASFTDRAGRLLSYSEIRDDCSKGTVPVPVLGPGTPAAGRANYNTYYAPLCNLVSYLAFAPSRQAPFATAPNSWDGVLRLNGGIEFSVERQLTFSPPWVVVGGQ